MKASILKWVYLASFLFFIDWIIMIITGCFAGMCNAPDAFFCGTYCLMGLALAGVSFLVVLFFIVRKKEIVE